MIYMKFKVFDSSEGNVWKYVFAKADISNRCSQLWYVQDWI